MLNERLEASQAAAEKADVQGAINEASRMLAAATSPDALLELIVISDFQRTNWGAADFSALPAATKIQLESVAESKTPDNLAIQSARFTGRLTRGTEADLEVVVANFCATVRNVRCEVTFANHAVTLTGVCPPLTKTTLSQSVGLSETGWIQGAARLLNNSDALPQDDVCPLVGQVQTVPTIGIVTREPPTKKRSATWYLERAIAPYTGEQAARQPRTQRIHPLRLGPQAIGQCQLLLLVRPGKLEAEQINLLASWLRRGRSLLYVTSELVDANNFRQLTDVLGQELQAPVELLPTLRDTGRDGFTIADVREKRRPFNVFGDALQPLLAGIRIGGGLTTRRAPNSLDDDVLATLNDRSTLLFTSSVGAGSIAVLNADLSESNVTRMGAFVPLVSELTDQLLPGGDIQTTAYCGEPLARLLPPEATEVSGLSLIHRPITSSGSAEATMTDAGQLRESGDGVVWQWSNPHQPGVASVMDGDRAVFSLALKSPPEEADLRALDEEVLTKRLAGGRDVRFRQSAQPISTRDDAWIWFAAGCVVAMVAEVLALKVFRM